MKRRVVTYITAMAVLAALALPTRWASLAEPLLPPSKSSADRASRSAAFRRSVLTCPRGESAAECHIRPHASCPAHETNAYGSSH